MYASKEELYLTIESLIVTSRVYKDTLKKKRWKMERRNLFCKGEQQLTSTDRIIELENHHLVTPTVINSSKDHSSAM